MVNPDKKPPVRLVTLLAIILLVFFATVFYSIDSKTVNSYKSYIKWILTIQVGTKLGKNSETTLLPSDLCIYAFATLCLSSYKG